MKRICVIDVAGLSPRLLRSVPRLWMNGLAQAPSAMAPTFPAVSASVQASMTTGVGPGVHGIIAGGIYRRQSKAMSFEERSNTLLAKKRFWHAKDMPRGTKVSLVFWANALAGAADFVLGANTYHCSDSQLIGQPMDLYWNIRKALPPFDRSTLWGPGASWHGAKWIAQAAGEIWQTHKPDLQWVYLPGLNFEIIRHGLESGEAENVLAERVGRALPDTSHGHQAKSGHARPTGLPGEVENALAEMDAMAHELAHDVLLDGGEVIVVSDGGYVGVDRWALPNLRLREAGLLKVVQTPHGEAVDLENSRAVAMVDHQVGHLFVDESIADAAARAVAADPAVAAVVPRDELFAPGLGHDRCGERIILAKNDAWLAHQWWGGRVGVGPGNGRPPMSSVRTTYDLPACQLKCGYDPIELFAGAVPDLSMIRASRGLVPPDPLDGCVFASTVAQAKAPSAVTELPAAVRAMMLGR